MVNIFFSPGGRIRPWAVALAGIILLAAFWLFLAGLVTVVPGA